MPCPVQDREFVRAKLGQLRSILRGRKPSILILPLQSVIARKHRLVLETKILIWRGRIAFATTEHHHGRKSASQGCKKLPSLKPQGRIWSTSLSVLDVPPSLPVGHTSPRISAPRSKREPDSSIGRGAHNIDMPHFHVWGSGLSVVSALLVTALPAAAGRAHPVVNGYPNTVTVSPVAVSNNAPPDDSSLESSRRDPLAGTTWQLVEIRSEGKEPAKPEDAPRYTLIFVPGGSVSVGAGCNRGRGTYKVSGDRLEFGPMALTRAMCPQGSLSDRYVRALNDVSTFRLKDGHLYIALKSGDGVMHFQPSSKPK